MKILIAGGGGMLGKDLMHILRNERIEFVSLTREQMNILSTEKIAAAIDEHRPDLIVNCAAYTKVDMAEIEKDKAFAVNGLGPCLLADACRRAGIRLVHVSTDYVFDGSGKRPYHPFDATAPLNQYGVSKLYGEHFITHSGCGYLIVRTSWLYGQHGENFVLKMLSLSQERESLDVVNDQFGSPTSTLTLARAITTLIKKEASGLLHVTDRTGNGISWCTFARKIMEVFGRSTKINAVTTEAFVRPARRPVYSVLDLDATEAVLGEKLPYWEVSLGEFKKRLKL